MMRTIGALLAVSVLAGCKGSRDNTGEEQAAAREASTLETAVDGFTGKYAVDAGKKAGETLRRVGSDKDKELEQALDM